MVLSYQSLKLLISVAICNTSSWCHLELVFSSREGLLFSLFHFLRDQEGFLIFLELVFDKAGFLIIFLLHLIAQMYLVSLCHPLTLEAASSDALLCHLCSPSFPQGPFLEHPNILKAFHWTHFSFVQVLYCMHIVILEVPHYLSHSAFLNDHLTILIFSF